jgi:hypothetical protein
MNVYILIYVANAMMNDMLNCVLHNKSAIQATPFNQTMLQQRGSRVVGMEKLPQNLGDTQNMNNIKASANSRRLSTLVQASSLNLSSTLLGKAEIMGERATHGFRSTAPWNVPVVNVRAWLQTFKHFIGCDVDHLSVGQMRRFNIRRIVVGTDGIRRVLFSEPQLVANGKVNSPHAWSQYVVSLGLRAGQIVEVVNSFA